MRIVALLICLLTGPWVAAESIPHQIPSPRPITVEDLFAIERLGRAAFSPDGHSLAFEVANAPANCKIQKLLQKYPELITDLYLAELTEGKTAVIRPITAGRESGEGCFMPKWSPDSSQLAFLKIAEGKIRLCLYTLATQRLQQFSQLPMRDDFFGGPLYEWLDRERLVCRIWDGAVEPNFLAAETLPGFRSADERRQSWTGRPLTAHVLEAGRAVNAGEDPAHREKLVIVHSGTSAVRELSAGVHASIFPSPDGRFLMAIKKGERILPPHGEEPVTAQVLLADAGVNVSLEVWETATGKRLGEFPAPSTISPSLLAWSPGKTQAAFPVGQTAVGHKSRVVILDLSSGKSRVAVADASSLEQMLWLDEERLLLRAHRGETNNRTEERGSWWLATPTEVQPADGQLKEFSGALFRLGNAPVVYGQAGRRMRKLDFSVTPPAATDASSVVIQRIHPLSQPDALLLQSEANFVLTLPPAANQSSVFVHFSKPLAPLRPVAHSPSGKRLLLRADTDQGSWLALLEPGGRPVELVRLNPWLRNIQPGQLQSLAYQNAAGKKLTARVLLPPNHAPGKRWPALVIHGVGFPGSLGVPSFLHPHLLAARGFVVLDPQAQGGHYAADNENPFQPLWHNLKPAIDALVSQGVVDPERIVALGHSFGGFLFAHLISITHRFSAAILIAPAEANLASACGHLTDVTRGNGYLHPLLF